VAAQGLAALLIRKAEELDLPQVLHLYSQLSAPGEPALTLEAARQVFGTMATYPAYTLYVATRDADVVGTFTLLVMDNLAHNGARTAIVENVSVEEAARGHGIGKAMMLFAMGLARDHGCYKLALSSNLARIEAHEFYRALGFEQHGLSFVVPLR
jgi:GNAT superfamily N-acetyltransferase